MVTPNPPLRLFLFLIKSKKSSIYTCSKDPGKGVQMGFSVYQSRTSQLRNRLSSSLTSKSPWETGWWPSQFWITPKRLLTLTRLKQDHYDYRYYDDKYFPDDTWSMERFISYILSSTLGIWTGYLVDDIRSKRWPPSSLNLLNSKNVPVTRRRTPSGLGLESRTTESRVEVTPRVGGEDRLHEGSGRGRTRTRGLRVLP